MVLTIFCWAEYRNMRYLIIICRKCLLWKPWQDYISRHDDRYLQNLPTRLFYPHNVIHLNVLFACIQNYICAPKICHNGLTRTISGKNDASQLNIATSLGFFVIHNEKAILEFHYIAVRTGYFFLYYLLDYFI